MPFTAGNEFRVNQITDLEQTTSSTNIFENAERPMQTIGMDANGNIVVVWSSLGQDLPTPDEADFWGVYARRYDVVTGQWSNEFLVNRDTPAEGDQRSGSQLAPAVAMDDEGDFVIAWSSNSFYQDDVSGYGIYAQRYDKSGNPLGSQFQINTTTNSDQFDTAIATDADGDFVVTWTSRNQDSPGSRGIYARRYSKTGTPLTGEIQVNTYTTNDQIHSSVAMDANGNFVVVWASDGQDGDSWGIFAQRFNADGTKNGAEFRVNTITTNFQRYPSVSMDATGNFVVTWTNNSGASNGGEDIYARRYNSSGAAQGAEFLVNQTTAGTQRFSQVKMLKTGGFIITWTGEDSGGTGIFARRYGANGQPLSGADGNQFRVNATQTGLQNFAAVAADSSGNFAVAWTSDHGGSEDVYIRPYSVTPLPNNPPTNITLSNSAIDENVADNSLVGTFASVDPDGDTSFSYELIGGTGSADNNAFTIVGNELRIKNSPDFETKSSYSIRVKTTDPGGLSFEKPVTITIRNLNEAPTGISIDSNTVNENVPVNTLVGRLSTTDPDANNTFSYRLVSGVGSTDNTLFEISGNELRIKAVPNFEVKPTYSIRIQSSDQNGLTVQRQFTINVRDLNEAPTNISISKNNINENVPVNSVVGTFSTTDPDANDTFTYELVTGQGGVDNNAFTIVGNELRIKNSPDFETKPSYSIRVRSRDKGGLATEKIFTININDLNDPPTNAAPTNLNLTPANINENVDPNALVGTLSTVDPNPGNTFTYTLVAGAGDTDNNTFTISGNQLRIKISPNFEQKSTYSIRVRTTDQGGLNFERALTININDLNEAPTDILLNPDTVDENVPAGSLVGNLTTLDPDRNETFTYQLVAGPGSADNGAFTLTADGKLSIKASPDFELKSSYAIRVRVTDKGGATLERQFVVNVKDLPDIDGTPTNLTLSNSEIVENSPANSVIGTLITTDDSNGPFTYTLDTSFGDGDKFTVNNDRLILKPVPDFETKPQYTIRVRTTDPDGRSLTKLLTVTVKDINEAPTNLTLSASTIDENKPADSVVGTFTPTDPDANETFTYSLVAGPGSADNSAFRIVGRELRLINAPNFETKPSYLIRVQVKDKGGLVFEKPFTINVRDVGERPTDIRLSATSIQENNPADAIVGRFSTVDPDPNETFTYELVTGTGSSDNAAFRMVNNELRLRNPANFETKPSYSIRVRTTDKDKLTFEKTFIISVTDVNERPIDLTLSSTIIDENKPANSVVGKFTTIDSDKNDSFTYQLVAGQGSADNSAFTIVNGELILRNRPDFETKPSYSIRVRTTDSKGLSLEKVFTIRVRDLNDDPGTNPPQDILLSNNRINENIPANSVVGNFSTIDPDQNETFTYTLVNGTGSADNNAFTIVNNQLRIRNIPDFETKPSYSIRVRTTDKGNLPFEKVFTINVNDLPELPGTNPPRDLLLSNSQIDENIPANSLVGRFSTVDPDIGDSFTYELVSGQGSTDNNAFALVNNELRLKGVPNFEAKPSYSIRVRTRDKGNLTLEKVFTITVRDLPETPGTSVPQDIRLSNNRINENVPVNSLVGNFSTVDPDTGDSFTYTLVTGTGDTDNSAFTIVNNELRLKASPDFETKPSYSIRVRTTDRGNLSFEKVFTINVIDLPENPGDTAPTDLLLSANTINENAPVDTVIGKLSTVDPDRGDRFTYALVPGFGDNSAFRIVGDELRITTSPDFETKPSYSIRVVTTDSGGRTFVKTLTINVINQNDAPIVTPSAGSLSYRENSGKVAVDPGVSLTDIDSPNLEGATVRILGYIPGQDSLELVAQNGITANFDAASGVLTLSGSAPLASYQQALRSVTYLNNSQNPTPAPRTIEFTARDGLATSRSATRTIQIVPVDTAPTVTSSGGRLSYLENSGDVRVDANLTVSDVDSLNLTSATVKIIGYVRNQDRLSVNAPAGIFSNFDVNTGTLTLTGEASIASYQAALRAVSYLNTSSNPNTALRTVQFSVRDGSATSNLASRSIQVVPVNSAPVVTVSSGNLSYRENAGQQVIDPQIRVVDADSQTLTGATVKLQGYRAGQDRLSAAKQAGITSSFNAATGVLTLNGTASVAAYQSVLRSVTYSNSSNNPNLGLRTVQFSVKDNSTTSNLAARSIQILPVNDAPVLQPSVQQLTFTRGSILIDPKLNLNDVDSSVLSGATVRIRDYIAGEDNLLFKDQNGITGSFDPVAGVLRLSGSAPVVSYRSALRSIRFANNRPIPTGTPRTLEFQATDGVSNSNPGRVQIQFAPTGNVPTIDLNGTAVGVDYGSTFVIGGPPVNIVATDARFTSQNYPVLTSAEVTLANPLDGINEKLSAVTAGTNIVASYDANRSVLTLGGRGSLGDYLQVLRTVKYENTDPAIDTTTRTILFQLRNGNSISEPAQTRVQISSIKLSNGTLGPDGSLFTTPATDLIDAFASDDSVVSILANLQQNDSIKGGLGRDTFTLLDGSGIAIIDVDNPVNQVGGILTGNTVINGFEVFRLTGFAGTATLMGSDLQDDSLSGGVGNDVIFGKAGNDVLGGNAGNDRLDGGPGDDQLEGGLGDDLYIVDSPNDFVIERLNEGYDTVESGVSLTLGNHLEALTLTGTATVGIGNDLDNQLTGNSLGNRLSGEAGNDRLVGGDGKDVLIGGDGNDRMIGEQGRDRMIGGRGKDTFVLTKARRSSRETIRDFRSVDDTIEIVRSGFSDSLKLGRVRASQFRLGTGAEDSSDRFIYNRRSGMLFFDADGVGGVGQVQIARLTNKAILNRTDLIVVDL